jgi:hypothetical protein
MMSSTGLSSALARTRAVSITIRQSAFAAGEAVIALAGFTQPPDLDHRTGITETETIANILVTMLDICHQFGYGGLVLLGKVVSRRHRTRSKSGFQTAAVDSPGQETAVERREAPRARSRRFSRGYRPVARAAPEARASGDIRPRGAAHDLGASRRSTPLLSGSILQNSGADRVAGTRLLFTPLPGTGEG